MALLRVSIVLAMIALAPPAAARPFRVTEIPNGGAKKCFNCHLAEDGKSFTDFGGDVKATLQGSGPVSEWHVVWQSVYTRDSDKDTFANGVELGDPLGTWTPGQPDPPGVTYNPGAPESHPPGTCENGVLEPDEECDGEELADPDCAALLLGTGQLTCGNDCRYDRTDCSNYVPEGGLSQVPAKDQGDDAGCSTAPRHGPPSGTGALVGAIAAAGAFTRWRRRRG